MSSNRDDVITFVTNSGVPHQEAEAAVDRCIAAMIKRGLYTGAATTVIDVLLTKNPLSGMAAGVLGAAAGAAAAPLTSPQCSDVRGAVDFWLKSSF